MNKITETELVEILKTYRNKAIIITLTGVIAGRLIIHKLKYDYRNYTIYFADTIVDNTFQIEMLLIYKITVNEDNTKVNIYLDNEEIISIEL